MESKDPVALTLITAGNSTGSSDCVLPLTRDHSAQDDTVEEVLFKFSYPITSNWLIRLKIW